LRIISVADPSHPIELGHCDTVGSAFGVAASGDYAYVGARGLWVISVADPSHPAGVGYRLVPGEARGVALTGDYAYLASSFGHLWVMRVADPSNPIVVGDLGSSSEANGVTTSGGFAYVATSYAGLRVDSVVDPTHPVEAGYYDMGGDAYGVALAGDFAYIAYGTNGLHICQFFGAGVAETINHDLVTMRPGSTIVRGVLFLEGATSHKPQAASLLDVAGRTVMDLHPGANGVSDLAPGVYFVRRACSMVRDASSVLKVIIAR
jgi:hypothetical protein